MEVGRVSESCLYVLSLHDGVLSLIDGWHNELCSLTAVFRCVHMSMRHFSDMSAFNKCLTAWRSHLFSVSMQPCSMHKEISLNDSLLYSTVNLTHLCIQRFLSWMGVWVYVLFFFSKITHRWTQRVKDRVWFVDILALCITDHEQLLLFTFLFQCTK